MKTLILLLVFLGSTFPSFAYRERFTKVIHAELQFEAGDKVKLSMDRTSLKSLELIATQGSSSVPKKDLEGIAYPKLDNIAVLFGTYGDRNGELKGVEYKYIRLNYGSEEDKAFGEYPSVSFFFYNGKYHHRDITRKVSDASWQINSSEKDKTK